MSSLRSASDSRRRQRAEHVASHLPSSAALLVRLLARQVHDGEISRTEGEVLIILGAGPRRITELADLGGVAQPTMTLLVRRLEERGWVVREGSPDDGRVVMVAITSAGSAVVEAFRARFLEALRGDLDELSDAELSALHAATETLGSFVELLQQKLGR